MLFRDIYKQSWEISLEKYLLDFSIFSICVHLCICILKKTVCSDRKTLLQNIQLSCSFKPQKQISAVSIHIFQDDFKMNEAADGSTS